LTILFSWVFNVARLKKAGLFLVQRIGLEFLQTDEGSIRWTEGESLCAVSLKRLSYGPMRDARTELLPELPDGSEPIPHPVQEVDNPSGRIRASLDGGPKGEPERQMT